MDQPPADEQISAATDPGGEPIAVENMRGWLLADGLVMLRYVSVNHGRRANRTSLWRRITSGHWQIFHHQGTLVNPDPEVIRTGRAGSRRPASGR